MTRCGNEATKDLLPELVRGTLADDARARTQAHVDGCADCRADVRVLERVRAALGPVPVDPARIAAAIPAYRRTRWSWSTPALRAAAVIVVVAGAATIGLALRRGDHRVAVASAPSVADSSTRAGSTRSATARIEAARPAPTARRTPVELATGEALQDLSESELRTLLAEIGALDAMTPSEPDVVVPAVERDGA